jgi:uncharacterized protein
LKQWIQRAMPAPRSTPILPDPKRSKNFNGQITSLPKPNQKKGVRIAVIADTHDRYPSTLPNRLRGADEIWHLGDVCEPTTLIAFEDLGPRLYVVQGNNDSYPRWPLTLKMEREKIRFFLVHIPPPEAPPDCDTILHGHTHVPRNDLINGVRWLNPGCVSRPNRGAPPSFAWMTIHAGKLLHWELVRL